MTAHLARLVSLCSAVHKVGKLDTCSIQSDMFKLLGLSLLTLLVGCVPRFLPETTSPTLMTVEAAYERLVDIRRSEFDVVKPECTTRLYGEPEPNKAMVVLLHGLTNCPQQFDALGRDLSNAGYSVFIPLLPDHGLVEEEDALETLTTDELIVFADTIAAMADVLSDRVIVAGLSGGGTIAAYLAQRSTQVDRVVMIAPFLDLYGVPTSMLDAVTNLALNLNPDQANSTADHAPHAYPGISSRAVGSFLLLSEEVLNDAKHQAPRVQDLVVITNEADTVVSNAEIALQIETWSRYPDVVISEYSFPEELALRHDLIDPYWQGKGLDTALVYPVITDFITQGANQ